jgi:hypothetical protein
MSEPFNSQSLLSEAEKQKVDDVCWNQLEKKNFDTVLETIHRHIPVRIPSGRLSNAINSMTIINHRSP